MLILIILIIAFICCAINSMRNYKKSMKFDNIKNKIEQNPEITEEILNEEFKSAKKIGDIWFLNNYLFFIQDMEADFKVNDDILWAYISNRIIKSKNGKIKNYYLSLIDKDGQENIIEVPKINIKNITEYFVQNLPNIYFGYNEELEMLLEQDINNINNFDKNLLDPYELKEE